jgi:hypothetical protein
MLKRGIITYDTFKQCLKIDGYDEKWHTSIYTALHRIPTFSELIRISDYVELPDLYVREVMRQNGYTDTSINYLAPTLQKRPLRDETRNLTTTYVYHYYRGYIAYDTFKSKIEALGLLPKEKELVDLYARERYNQYVLELKMDIIENRVRSKDLTTEQEISNELKNIGVQEEIANLLASKWYWHYIVGTG